MLLKIDYKDFLKVEIRSGTIVKAEYFSETKIPAYKIWVDFGKDLGIMKTSSQVADNYNEKSLIGKSVIGCINLGIKRIAGFDSDFLLLGFEDQNGFVKLATFDAKVENGKRLL